MLGTLVSTLKYKLSVPGLIATRLDSTLYYNYRLIPKRIVCHFYVAMKSVIGLPTRERDAIHPLAV